MEIVQVPSVKGCFKVFFDRFGDERGAFQELFNSKRYPIDPPVQVSWSNSKANVVRGIHCSPYGKLCTVITGKAFDVVVDLRPDSHTYLNWVGEWLSPESKNQMYVPPGCGHGFFAAEDNTNFVYMQGGTYDKAGDKEWHWRSIAFGIVWPPASEYILSEKDKIAPVYVR